MNPTAHVRGHKALQKLAGIQLHGDLRLKAALVERFSMASRVRPTLGSKEREAHHVGDAEPP